MTTSSTRRARRSSSPSRRAWRRASRIDPTQRTATGSIQDNDDPPAAKVANAPDVVEGNSGARRRSSPSVCRRRAAATSASRSPPATAPRRRGRTTSPRTGVLRIPAGELSGTVADRRDRRHEVRELRSPSRSSSARHDETAVMGAPAEGTREDRRRRPRHAPPAGCPRSLSIADVTGDEPAGQAGTVTFRVTARAGRQRARSRVKWATADGTATAGKDYTAGSGTLSFAPDETTKTVAVTLLGDEQAESNETFFVNLSGAGRGHAGRRPGSGHDRRAGRRPPSLSITDVLARESEGATFTVELTRAAVEPRQRDGQHERRHREGRPRLPRQDARRSSSRRARGRSRSPSPSWTTISRSRTRRSPSVSAIRSTPSSRRAAASRRSRATTRPHLAASASGRRSRAAALPVHGDSRRRRRGRRARPSTIPTVALAPHGALAARGEGRPAAASRG